MHTFKSLTLMYCNAWKTCSLTPPSDAAIFNLIARYRDASPYLANIAFMGYAKCGNENHIQALQLARSDDLDVNQTAQGETALILASRYSVEKSDGVVEALLSVEGIRVNRRTREAGWNSGLTALVWAAWNGNERVVRWLLEKKDIDVNCADRDGSE